MTEKIYERVRYSRPGAITSPAIERALSQSIRILKPTEESHEKPQKSRAPRAETIEPVVEYCALSQGHGFDASAQADGDHRHVPGSGLESGEVQVSAALVDVGIDTDPSDVI